MKIGVFDSGIGGLTVLREIRRRWPGHDTIYLGDTARVPYGSKSSTTVARYARQNSTLLLDRGIDLLVIACNTASAYAIDTLTDLPIPVVGMIEPGARAAANLPVNDFVGVIATHGTVASGAYQRALECHIPGVRTESIACPLFVPIVDEGFENHEIARLTIHQYLSHWLPGNPERPDAILLGCTHYPLLKQTLGNVLGPDVTLIDSAEAAAEALAPILQDQPTKPDSETHHDLLLTDAAPSFHTIATRILGDIKTTPELVDL